MAPAAQLLLVRVSAIVEAKEQYATDLIVMSTPGRTGPARWLLGRVAEALPPLRPLPRHAPPGLGPWSPYQLMARSSPKPRCRRRARPRRLHERRAVRALVV